MKGKDLNRRGRLKGKKELRKERERANETREHEHQMENERENLEIKKLEMVLQLEQIKRENQAEVTRTSGPPLQMSH